jgi:predicted  nucleic acid-binding Zn-ribbon protein
MNPTLESLVRLQQAENDLRRVEGELAALPAAKAAAEKEMAEERVRLDEAKAALDGSQKSRKQHETSVQDLETRRSKYKGQLMEVKTNKEYTAMLHEIEGVEREIREREDLILAEMEKTEGLAAAAKSEETLFKSVLEKGRTELAALEARATDLQARARKLAEDRDRMAAAVPEDELALFRRVAKLRGAAVSAAVESMCTLCHLKLRPQMWVDLKKNDQVIQCPGCSRILFYEAPVPEVHPLP